MLHPRTRRRLGGTACAFRLDRAFPAVVLRHEHASRAALYCRAKRWNTEASRVSAPSGRRRATGIYVIFSVAVADAEDKWLASPTKRAYSACEPFFCLALSEQVLVPCESVAVHTAVKPWRTLTVPVGTPPAVADTVIENASPFYFA